MNQDFHSEKSLKTKILVRAQRNDGRQGCAVEETWTLMSSTLEVKSRLSHVCAMWIAGAISVGTTNCFLALNKDLSDSCQGFDVHVSPHQQVRPFLD